MLTHVAKACPYRDFNGDLCIHPVLVEEVNVVNVEALQARFAGCSDVLRISADGNLAGRRKVVREFGRQLDLLSPNGFQGLMRKGDGDDTPTLLRVYSILLRK